jgi:hypothetical protein
MNTAKENISLLPDKCYGVLLMDNSLIVILAGEQGYHPISQPSPVVMGGKSMDEFCNELNKELNVTVQQRKAMEWGSQFGYESTLANPNKYDEHGKPISNG